MTQWGPSDSGILRKNRVVENLDQLLVFGYSCKIFRDDEKALYIDQGKHLIPWMGDETLKIDRYDGRGALPDVKKFEASREGYDALRWLGLSDSEKKLEELCDSERYYSLEINEEEEEMYKEEAAKRQKTNAFAFNYNNPEPPEIEPIEGVPTVPEKEEEDEPYKPLPGLDVPVDINMPKTVKEYARIEKTALFVCRQGPQMEILIKAKQADNPQFSFLVVQDPLYKFYRHVLSAFKSGIYQPQCDKKPDEPKAANSHEDHDSHYLHPSLVSASGKPDPPLPPQNPPIPTVTYRPSADCSYSQLVNRIQGSGLNNNGNTNVQGAVMGQQQILGTGQSGVSTEQIQAMNQMSLEQQYHQYYYVQQFYEYWRQTVISSEQGAMYASLPLNFSELDPNMQSYIHQIAWAQFVQHHQKQAQEAQQTQAQAQSNANNNSYAQIVSNLNKDMNPYTANVPQLPPPETISEDTKPVSNEEQTKEERTVTLENSEENQVKKPLLSLAAAYGSGSDSESDSSDVDSEGCEKQEPEEKIEVFRAPSGEMQTVIDKMAEYVAKNGAQFEDIIKQKGDTRFHFLNEGHEFNKYYRAKLKELRGEPEECSVKKEEKTKAKSKVKKVVAPVSFSIKKPKDESSKEIKSALPMEDSSEEESYLDNISKSPASTDKNTSSSSTSSAQKVSANPKTIYKICQTVSTNSSQPKNVTFTSNIEDGSNNGPVNEYKSGPNKENSTLSVERSSPTNSKRSEYLLRPKSPRRRSKSRSLSPRRSGRSWTPKKRSRSPTKSPIPQKRPKSRSRSPYNKSPLRIRERSPETASVSTKEEQKIRTKKRKPSTIDMFDVGDHSEIENGKTSNGLLDQDDPILEMIELETDAKTAEEKSADAKEKARQLERKRKAAMFLKLKSAEAKPLVKPHAVHNTDTSSPTKSEKPSSSKYENKFRRTPSSSTSSRRNSEDSVITIRSRSRTREKSTPKEKLVSKEQSRSKSKESTLMSRRSRSRERRKDSKKSKSSRNKDRSRSKGKGEEDRKKKKEKKKKSHKRKHSKSKKKSKKHKRTKSVSRSRSRSKSMTKSSRSRSRSASVKSHISIDSS